MEAANRAAWHTVADDWLSPILIIRSTQLAFFVASRLTLTLSSKPVIDENQDIRRSIDYLLGIDPVENWRCNISLVSDAI